MGNWGWHTGKAERKKTLVDDELTDFTYDGDAVTNPDGSVTITGANCAPIGFCTPSYDACPDSTVRFVIGASVQTPHADLLLTLSEKETGQGWSVLGTETVHKDDDEWITLTLTATTSAGIDEIMGCLQASGWPVTVYTLGGGLFGPPGAGSGINDLGLLVNQSKSFSATLTTWFPRRLTYGDYAAYNNAMSYGYYIPSGGTTQAWGGHGHYKGTNENSHGAGTFAWWQKYYSYNDQAVYLLEGTGYGTPCTTSLPARTMGVGTRIFFQAATQNGYGTYDGRAPGQGYYDPFPDPGPGGYAGCWPVILYQKVDLSWSGGSLSMWASGPHTGTVAAPRGAAESSKNLFLWPSSGYQPIPPTVYTFDGGTDPGTLTGDEVDIADLSYEECNTPAPEIKIRDIQITRTACSGDPGLPASAVQPFILWHDSVPFDNLDTGPDPTRPQVVTATVNRAPYLETRPDGYTDIEFAATWLYDEFNQNSTTSHAPSGSGWNHINSGMGGPSDMVYFKGGLYYRYYSPLTDSPTPLSYSITLYHDNYPFTPYGYIPAGGIDYFVIRVPDGLDSSTNGFNAALSDTAPSNDGQYTFFRPNWKARAQWVIRYHHHPNGATTLTPTGTDAATIHQIPLSSAQFNHHAGHGHLSRYGDGATMTLPVPFNIDTFLVWRYADGTGASNTGLTITPWTTPGVPLTNDMDYNYVNTKSACIVFTTPGGQSQPLPTETGEGTWEDYPTEDMSGGNIFSWSKGNN